MFPFYNPKNHHKNSVFLVFSMGIKWERWPKMNYLTKLLLPGVSNIPKYFSGLWMLVPGRLFSTPTVRDRLQISLLPLSEFKQIN